MKLQKSFQFRFASRSDLALISTGILAAFLGGCSMPIMIVLFGDLANAFVSNELDAAGQVCKGYGECCEGEQR